MIYQEVPQPSHYPYDSIAYATGTNVNYNYQGGVFQGSSGHLHVTVTPTNATVEYVRSYRPSDLGPGLANRMVAHAYTIARAPAAAAFSAAPARGGAPLSVTFTDTSTGSITNRFWDFGDDATTNTATTSLTHTYTIPGSNTVQLTVSGPFGRGTTAQFIVATALDSVGDGIPDWWRAQYFGGAGTQTNNLSCAACDPMGTGQDNLAKYRADLNPTNAASRLAITRLNLVGHDVGVTWVGGRDAWQYVECSPSLTSTHWTAIFTNVPPTAITNVIHVGASATTNLFYRIQAERRTYE
jgi:PKD repeat protein